MLEVKMPISAESAPQESHAVREKFAVEMMLLQKMEKEKPRPTTVTAPVDLKVSPNSLFKSSPLMRLCGSNPT